MEENKMGVMPVNKLLISMALPMMISMLVQALYNIVDSMFVAQISENALTAVSLAFPAQNLMIAIGTVLSNIKFFTLPNGGSVTLLSMLPFVLVSFRHGVKWGLFTGFVNGCLQMLLGFWAPPTPTFLYFLGEVLLDYLVAFMALGTAEFFARPFKNRMVGVAVGTFMAGFLRFMCSFLSGVLVWGNLNEGLSAWTYSLVYNGSYMLPETLLTMVAAVLLCRVAPQIFDRQHAKA